MLQAESGREQFQYVDADLGSDAVATTLSGLRAATTYWLRVAAAGGAPAPELRARTPSDAPAAPPANVSAASTGATVSPALGPARPGPSRRGREPSRPPCPQSILVRWEAPPPRTHRGPLTGFKIRYRPAPAAGAPPPPGRRKADSLTTPADARRAELRGLDTATAYQVGRRPRRDPAQP